MNLFYLSINQNFINNNNKTNKMNKKLIYSCLIMVLLFIQQTINAQVTIGSGDSPSPTALLDLKQRKPATDGGDNSDLGLALPRVKLVGLNELKPMLLGTESDYHVLKAQNKGLVVYNLTNNTDFKEGLYTWDGTKWVQLTKVIGANNGLQLVNGTIELGGWINQAPLALTSPRGITGNSTNYLQINSSSTEAAVANTDGALRTNSLRISGTGQTPGAGKVLTSDGNGNASWLDNTIFTTDLTNKRVGIGTASPTTQVEIGGQESPVLYLHSNANAPKKGGVLQFTESDSSFGMSLRHNTAPILGKVAEGLHFVSSNNGIDTIMTLDQANKNVGIGTRLPDRSAILDLTSTNKGLLLPRVALTSTQDKTTIVSPVAGLVVYNTVDASSGVTMVQKGNLYVWNGTEWSQMVDRATFNNTLNNSLNNLGVPRPALFELKANIPNFLVNYDLGSQQVASMKQQVNNLPNDISFDESTNTITFKTGGYYMMTFVYEAFIPSASCTVASYFFDFPDSNNPVGTTRIHSTATWGNGSASHGGTITYTAYVKPGTKKIISLGRGQSGNCAINTPLSLLAPSTQFLVMKIGQ